MKIEYLSVLILTAVCPVILANHRGLRLYRWKKPLAWAVLLPSLVYYAWDIAAVWRGHWSFNEKFITGIRLVNLPLEEYLFFPVVAFVSIFTYEVIKSAWGDRIVDKERKR